MKNYEFKHTQEEILNSGSHICSKSCSVCAQYEVIGPPNHPVLLPLFCFVFVKNLVTLKHPNPVCV